MTSNCSAADPSHELAISALEADAVYMFLHPGWRQEQRANRWHFAKRWARHLPVTLVIPDTIRTGQVREPEPRLDHVDILRVVPNGGPYPDALAEIQIAQVLKDMNGKDVKKPILWAYNANLAETFVSLPAAKRVHHVTENYFDFPSMSSDYLRRVEEVTRHADLNVAVSNGCAEPLRSMTEDDRLLVVTNGCDFEFYGAPKRPDEDITAMRSGFARVAVFAGNINARLDLMLLEQLVQTFPDILFLLIGPTDLNAPMHLRLRRMSQRFRNLRVMDEVSAERLPAIYLAADIGFIPYVRDRWITENGFPLKALEMAAAGLPVVSSFMKPLSAVAPPLCVTHSNEEFVAQFTHLGRSDELSRQLRAVAAANDYDAKFAEIAIALSATSNKTFPIPISRNSAIMTKGPRVSLATRFQILKLYLSGPISRFVDRLPPSLRKWTIGVKRLLLG